MIGVNLVTAAQLEQCGLDPATAHHVAQRANDCLRDLAPADCWKTISQTILRPSHPFAAHRLLHDAAYGDWDWNLGPPPAWMPNPVDVESSNAGWLMRRAGVTNHRELHRWSVAHREEYWEAAIDRLEIRFREKWRRLLDVSAGVEAARWLEGARMNIVESCFSAPPGSTAIVHQAEGGPLQTMTVAELASLTDRVAGSLRARGFRPGDALAIIMPLTPLSVAIYLGIIKAGCVVVSIPDSFQPPEIRVRLRLGGAVAVFTQELILRGGKSIPLYDTVAAADAPPAIVIPGRDQSGAVWREQDASWPQFLAAAEGFEAVARDPADHLNILFSSGTTGEPKAIPWSHSTPIKCAADAHFHHDIRPGDVLVWPTNLGWMMGPWLIFASLINRATIGLFEGAPTGVSFGRFVQDARATMLGVVPSLVKAWRASRCMEGLDWSAIRAFSSTGECSNAEDMFYLMSLAGYRPVIEYCGGTEIGGAYITGTMTLPNAPAVFNTPALGLDFVIADERGRPTTSGELFLVPPSIGLSAELLHQDHHAVYFAGTPRGPDGAVLRRHGDRMESLPGGCWRAQGRADDTMNLGGIKVSSSEIERAVLSLEAVRDAAAVAVSPPGGGPGQLVIFAVTAPGASAERGELLGRIQQAIRSRLNPLFKVHDVVVIAALPRTASNKVMRRVLRDQYRRS